MRLPYNLFHRDQFLRLLDKPPGRERIDEQAGGGSERLVNAFRGSGANLGYCAQDLVNRRQRVINDP
jgi:hypothetical protein